MMPLLPWVFMGVSMPAFTPVSSSNVAAIAYDDATQTLTVQFHRKSRGVIVGTRSYEYYGVPRGVYEGFLGAGSKGTFHHAYIRHRYDYKEI